jgi:uncharacterized membrane protein YuzA (DUF378 family)
MKIYNIVEDTKKEIVNNILDSTAFKVAKYTAIGLGAVYALGFVFKVLAFTKTNLNEFRRSLKP